MSLGVIVCFEDQELEEALHRMMTKRVSQLPVLDRKRRLVGRISLEDFVFQPQGRPAVEHVLHEPQGGGAPESSGSAGGRSPSGTVFSMDEGPRP
jgi:hypothetical protein